MTNSIKSLLRKAGLQIKKYPDRDMKSRQLALNNFGINKIFDVGANTGQYAIDERKFGFKGEIISFEPLSSAYKILEKGARKDPYWTTKNMALGNMDGEITINIAKNSQSSSILEMLPSHIKCAPESVYINNEKVVINKLDTIFKDYYKDGDRVLLKIDTQGYEKDIIDGAEISLSKIKGIKLEMSLIPLYKGEMLFWEMIKYIENKGFTLYSLENTYHDPCSGQLLQMDGTFYK